MGYIRISKLQYEASLLAIVKTLGLWNMDTK